MREPLQHRTAWDTIRGSRHELSTSWVPSAVPFEQGGWE